jgi:drug/metabolite transporter (DMT)-like permease
MNNPAAPRSVASAYFAVLAAAAILGFNPVATKLIYHLPGGLEAWQFVSSRPAWCLPLYVALAFAFRPRGSVAHADLWKFVVLGLCYGPGTGGLLPMGLSLTSASHAVLLFALGPPLTAALGAIVLRESLPPLKIVAIVLGIAGAVVVTFARAHAHPSSLEGDLLVTGMVVATAVQALLLRRIAGAYSPFFIAAIYGAIGSVMLLGVTLPLGGWQYVMLPLHVGGVGAWLFFGEIVIGVSILAQALQSLALHTLKAALVSALLRYGALLVGTAAAFFMLRERLTIAEIAGGVLLAASVAFTLLPDGRPKVRHLMPQHDPDFHPLH